MSTVLDAAAVLIILITIWLSYKRGLLYTVVGLVGYVLSILAALALSTPLGTFIYTNLLKGLLMNGAKSYISNQVSSASSSLLGSSGQGLSALLGQSSSGIANTLLESIVQPIGLSIGKGIAFLLLFFLFIAAVHILEGLAVGLCHVPVLGFLNRIGGAALGIVKAALILFVICTLFKAVLSTAAASSFPISSAAIDKTVVFKYFYQANPLASILLKR